jgi:hypothetical protein
LGGARPRRERQRGQRERAEKIEGQRQPYQAQAEAPPKPLPCV